MSGKNDRKTDDDLTKQLKDTFPASDSPSVTRASSDKRTGDMDAARIDRLPPRIQPPEPRDEK